MPTVTEQFETICSQQTTSELVPFLVGLSKPDTLVVRGQVLHFIKHGIPKPRPRGIQGWTVYPQLSSVPAEAFEAVETLPQTDCFLAASKEESALFFLTALATYSRKEAFGNGFNWWGSLAHDFFKSRREDVWAVLRHAKPTWLSDWLMGRNGNSLADYWVLRDLADAGFIEYRPLDFSSRFALLAFWQTPAQLREQLTGDTIALQRDLMSQFESELSVARFDGQTYANYEKHTWLNLIVDLVNSHHLDRADILTRCLLALRRDFRRPLLTWFKNLFLALRPTPAEIIARQDDFVELLSHSATLVANFALDQLHGVRLVPGFQLAALLPGADHLCSRPELKTGLRKLLGGLPKLLQQDAHQAPAVATLLAAALSHPDGGVQEAAARGLAGLLAKPTPQLTDAEITALLSTIAGQAAQLSAPARTALAAWLAVAPAETTAVPTAAYAPIGAFVPEISAATAIAPVHDWHELLFLTGQVLRHDDPAAPERWLDGLLRLRHTLPAGHAAQLRPYLVQLLPQLKTATEANVTALLRGPLGLFGHPGLAQAVLLSWLTGFAVPRVSSVQVAGPHAARTPLVLVEQQRYQWAEDLLRTPLVLPLLSTPTHAPAWVAPAALVARLLAYQAAGQPPNAADLTVALARIAHAHSGSSTEALRQLPQLADSGLRELLGWFLGPAGRPLPVLPVLPVAAGPSRAAGLQTPVTEALPELWAVAARTKSPAASFPGLPAGLGYDHPGATQPARASWRTEQREQTRRELHQPGQPTTTHRWTELRWDGGPGVAAPSALLLYTTGTNAKEHGSWEHNQMLVSDFTFLVSLLPNSADSLYAYVLNSAAWADNLEASERDLVALALRQLLAAGPGFGPAESALVASGLIHHTGLCRSLAQEVVLRAVAHGRLLPAAVGEALGHQLAAGYAPVPRLTDTLKPLQGLDALTDDALRQLLDALLPELPAEPPRNVRKLLEAYADLLARTRQPAPAAVQTRLRGWRAQATLKKVVALLLG